MHSVLETVAFTRRADALLTRTERDALVNAVAFDPRAGDIVPGLGGVRKLRWAPAGRGKRGAYRVIYYLYDEAHPIVALSLYAKNEQSDVSPAQRKAILTLITMLKEDWRWQRKVTPSSDAT